MYKRQVLARHNWPGNVRELENVLGHACIMAVAETIDVQDLPEYLRFPLRTSAAAAGGAVAVAPGDETFEAVSYTHLDVYKRQHYTSESAVAAIQKGASDYLNKPVSISALRERISKLILSLIHI